MFLFMSMSSLLIHLISFEVINFDEVQFINVFFYGSHFCVSKKTLSNPRSQRISIFYSKHVIVLCFTFNF